MLEEFADGPLEDVVAVLKDLEVDLHNSASGTPIGDSEISIAAQGIPSLLKIPKGKDT